MEYLKQVVIEDRLGIAAELEQRLQFLVDTYECEWAQVVRNPELQKRFRHFANTAKPDDTLRFVEERGQRRPADWVKSAVPVSPALTLPAGSKPAPEAPADEAAPSSWVPLASVEDFPRNGGLAVQYGRTQLAIFQFASRGEWYATQNRCPHMQDMVLARGLLGDHQGQPKVACPLHKKTFHLQTGAGLSDPAYHIATFPVKLEAGIVFVRLPPEEILERRLCTDMDRCHPAEAPLLPLAVSQATCLTPNVA